MTKYIFVPLSIALILVPLFTSAAACPNLTRNLSFGSRGSDVVELQNFLIAEGDLATGMNTGYFGRLTRDGVRKFQCREIQICSGSEATNGWGFVGPRTRAKIASVCGGASASSNFSAYPMSGNAPLTVNFSYPGPNSGSYSMEYGDSNLGNMTLLQTPCRPGSQCNGYYHSSHTNNSAGTYTVQLFRQPLCVAGQPCMMYDCAIGHACGESAGTLTITVTGNTSATSGLYGKITKTTGNCMPGIIDPNNPGAQGPNTCNTFPVSTDVYAYPPYKSSAYIEPLEWSGTGAYEYFGVSAVLEDNLYGAPLAVNFSTSNHQGGAIVFGDGEQVACAATGSYPGPCNKEITHIYRQAGTYVAKLLGPAEETLQQARIRVLESGLSPIARTTSDSTGNYSMQLPPGKYSVLVKDNGSIACASVNSEGFCMTEIKSGTMTLQNVNINAAVW